VTHSPATVTGLKILVPPGPAGGKIPANTPELADEGERLSIEELVTATKIYVAIALDISTKARGEIEGINRPRN
jgi:hypothetical protein